MADYQPIKLFKVCVIASKTDYPTSINQLVDTSPHTEPFLSYDAAVKWIENSGARREVYTIVEIYKIP